MSDKGHNPETEKDTDAHPATALARMFLDLWQANLKAFAADQQRLPDEGETPKSGGAHDA